MELPIKCGKTTGQCEWVGTIRTKLQHKVACKSIPCPNQCKGDSEKTQLILRSNLEKHLHRECPNREVSCKKCGEKGMYTRMKQSHDSTCRKKEVRCPNEKCTEVMAREKIIEHVSNHCGYTVISCKYADIGCEVKLKRQDMVGHEQEDDKNHLHMALDLITSLKSTVASLNETQTTLKTGESILLRLNNFKARKERNDKFQSAPFYTHRYGYLMLVQFYANGFASGKGTHVSAYVRILEGQYSNELIWPFNGTVTVKLLNQLTNDRHVTKEIKPNTQVHEVDSTSGTLPRGCAKFIAHSQLDRDSVRNTQYLMNDVLYFRVSVDVPCRKMWLE